MIVASSVDWTTVIVAGITAVPATIAALYSVMSHRSLRTPSGRPIGRQVESMGHTAIANHMLLRKAAGLPQVREELDNE